jgi:hypothetical protein
MVQVGYADFIKLCRIDDPENWKYCISVRQDGVYIVSPPDEMPSGERAILCEHPDKDLSKPVITFPCSLDQFQTGLENIDRYGCIDPFDMAEFVRREMSLILEQERADAAKKGLNTQYLDTNHEHYAAELAKAVEVWLKLYGTCGTLNPKLGHKGQLQKALDGQGLSQSAIKRIATVVNPNKAGGAPTVSE